MGSLLCIRQQWPCANNQIYTLLIITKVSKGYAQVARALVNRVIKSSHEVSKSLIKNHSSLCKMVCYWTKNRIRMLMFLLFGLLTMVPISLRQKDFFWYLLIHHKVTLWFNACFYLHCSFVHSFIHSFIIHCCCLQYCFLQKFYAKELELTFILELEALFAPL